jgi:predicted  nucleic acid-binding Zn-ribbon protein
MPKEQEIDALKGEAEYLEDALEGIRKRIEELEGEAKT